MDTRVNIENDNKPARNFRRDSISSIHVLYYDISGYSGTNQFLICCAGVFALYLIYGYLQVRQFTITREYECTYIIRVAGDALAMVTATYICKIKN